MVMVKPEWGIKRLCFSCGTKFYDLLRSPISCPKCKAVIDPEAIFKARRVKAVANDTPSIIPPILDPLDSDLILDDVLDVDLDADNDEAPLMEDADDLAESDDMAEVIDHRETEDEA